MRRPTQCIRRHRADWVANFLYLFEHNQEEPTPLTNTAPKWNPRSEGRVDPLTGVLNPDNPGFGGYRGPLCWETFIPPQYEIGYKGELLTITSSDIKRYRQLALPLRDKKTGKWMPTRRQEAWLAYLKGNNYSIFRYVPSRGRVRITTQASGKVELHEMVLAFERLFPCPPAVLAEPEVKELAVA